MSADLAQPAADRRWLFGPVPDLLLGCGLGYVVLFLALVIAGSDFERLVPFALFPLLNIFTGAPHYGATLIRVYDRREDRRAYAFFAVYVSIGLFGAFLWGLSDAVVGSWLLTIYLTWSPWHYAGQNYGIALLFLHRRDVPVDAGLKRLVYASFVLSFGLTFLALHGESPTASYAPVALSGPVYQLLPLGIPAPVVSVSMNAIAAGYALVLLALGIQLLRRASLRDVAPAALLIVTQGLWFSAPALARQWGVLDGLVPFSIQRAEYAFIWIAIGHSVQYLWITAYYARAQGRSHSSTRFFLKSLAAGMAIWTVPTLLFAPGVLGRLPYDAGLGVLVAAMVNIHHFVLDGVIWKLRDGRVARVLLRAREAETPDEASSGRPLVWGLVAFAGILSVAVTVLWLREDVYAYHPALARGDLERAELALARLAWLGRDNPAYRTALATERARSGDASAARAHLEAGLTLQPTARAWLLLGNLHESSGEWSEAAGAYESAVALRPDAAVGFYRLGLMRLALGEVFRARVAFEQALALAPDNPAYREARDRVETAIEAQRRGGS